MKQVLEHEDSSKVAIVIFSFSQSALTIAMKKYVERWKDRVQLFHLRPNGKFILTLSSDVLLENIKLFSSAV